MGYEDPGLRGIHKERREKPRGLDWMLGSRKLREVHEKISPRFRDSAYAIQESDFFDLYGEENVYADMEKVLRKMKEFDRNDSAEQKEAKIASDVFEAITIEHAELSNWLGENVTMLKTSRYDDFFNGTDMLAEWQEKGKESRVLAISVDLTFGLHTSQKKMERIREQVDRGQLTSIKYFKTADDTFRGERGGLAKVVLGVSRPALVELSRLWLNNDKKALAKHPIQRVLIEEMHQQLTAIRDYAKAVGEAQVAEAYDRSLQIVEHLRVEKQSVPLGELAHDPVYQEILSQTRLSFHAKTHLRRGYI